MTTPSNRVNLFAKVLAICLTFCALSQPATAQLNVTAYKTAAQLTSALAGTGVTITNPVLTCASAGNGTFTTGVVSPIGISNGIVLSTGSVIDSTSTTTGQTFSGVANPEATGPSDPSFASTDWTLPGDTQLSTAAGGEVTHDACILQFDFKPAGDTIRFNYVFGSEEYADYTCSDYNDVFAFFISGGAYTTPTNLALVPGTNIPVCINSVNCGATGIWDISTCNSLGAGSPFCAYFVNNELASTTSNPYVVYNGLTTLLQVVAAVNPCDTYHLKLAIADGVDGIYDSGVFLQGGSLTSNTTTGVTATGTSGLPYCIRSCAPGNFVFSTPVAQDTDIVVRYVIDGTAVNGYDYATIPDSVIISAGTLSSQLDINTLNVTPTGPKVVTLEIEVQDPCHPGVFVIGAAANLTILDSFSFHIVTPDTTICLGNNVNIIAIGDSQFSTILHYSWAPNASIDFDTSLTPIVTPTVTTTYVLTASTDPVLGCASESHQLTISVLDPATPVIFTDTICFGASHSYNVAVGDSETYQYLWTSSTGPTTYLNDNTIPNPTATPTISGAITYTVTISPPDVAACANIDIANLFVVPNTINLVTPDTAICQGNRVQVIAFGEPFFTYQWLPTAGIANSNLLSPVITPDTSATYVVTTSFHSCPDIHDTLRVDVQPRPNIYMGFNRGVCENDTLNIASTVTPMWYSHYSYSWSPATNLDNTTGQNVIYRGSSVDTTEIYLTVNTPVSLTTDTTCRTIDSIQIIVHPDTFELALADVDICPRQSVLLTPVSTDPSGIGATFHWYPSLYMSDSLGAAPLLSPITSQTYTVVATSIYGCKDTLGFTATVRPGALIEIGADSVTLAPGETYTVNLATNCSSFSWFPPAGLSDATISNPIMSPGVSTEYVVTGTTIYGCVATDSINVFVDPSSVLSTPNAFAPGNGPNSDFKIIKRGIATLNYFRIFNRWGNTVFETNDIDKGWDGQYNGTPQPFGVYVYAIEAVTSEGKIFLKHGNITLIR